MVSKNYYKLAYYNFVKQSKAKQSKAKLLLYLLTNNLHFYISQFFKTFDFLIVSFDFSKTLSLRVKRSNPNLKKFYTKWIASGDAFAMTVKNNFSILNLVKSFLTSINFDSLPKENKNPCLVINKN